MSNVWLNHYLIRVVILALILACIAIAAIFWILLRRWQRRQKALEQALAVCQATHFKQLYADFHQMISHEYNKGLYYILNKSSETLEGLGKERTVLHDKQEGIIAKAEEMKQHATNILNVFGMEPDMVRKELVNIRLLVEKVMQELFPYAESQGVTLRTTLNDFEPIILDPNLTALAIRNIIHNAIKYSDRGRVVDITLSAEDVAAPSGKMITITVKDRGRGIKDEDKERLFELHLRADGLIEPGNGLGLFISRRAMRLQGGDVVLVSSVINEGSVFKISLPFTTAGETIHKTEAATPQKTRTALTWGLAITGLLGTAVLLFVLFRPPPQVAILSTHDRYVTAAGEKDGWVLKQEEALGECGKFTLLHQTNGKVALLTCHDRFVSAPWRPNDYLVTTQHAEKWQLGQEPGLGDCEQFKLIEQSDNEQSGDQFILETCVGMVVTAGDGGWEPPMDWSIVAEKANSEENVKDWEIFTLVTQP